MNSATAAASQAPSHKALWTGRILAGLVILLLLMDSVMKVVKAPAAMQGTMQLGYPAGTVARIGVILLVSLIAYAVPRTSILGAVLLTGYLGGAVASQVRVGNPLFGFVLFPVYLGVILWLALYLRDARVRALLPLRK